MAAHVAARFEAAIASACSTATKPRPGICSRSALAMGRWPSRPWPRDGDTPRSRPVPSSSTLRRAKGPHGHRIVDATHPHPRRHGRRCLRRSGARAHERHRCGAQFTAEARRALRPVGIFFVVVPDYLKERTVLLGRRLHPQLCDDRAACDATPQRRRLQDGWRRAEHRRSHGYHPGCAGGGSDDGQLPGSDVLSLDTPAAKSCCSKSVRTCSRR